MPGPFRRDGRTVTLGAVLLIEFAAHRALQRCLERVSTLNRQDAEDNQKRLLRTAKAQRRGGSKRSCVLASCGSNRFLGDLASWRFILLSGLFDADRASIRRDLQALMLARRADFLVGKITRRIFLPGIAGE